MMPEFARRGELSQLVPDHVLADVDRQVHPPIVDGFLILTHFHAHFNLSVQIHTFFIQCDDDFFLPE